MNLPKQCVIKIWIPKQGFVRQGKLCLIEGKPCFIANMTARKWWKNFSGYAISKRILDKLPRGTKIIFKRVDLNTHYETNKTRFYKKGILVSYGSHSQIVLPIKNWKTHQGKLADEPTDLPVLTLERAFKRQPEGEKHIVEDFTIPNDVRLRLKEVWEEKYA